MRWPEHKCVMVGGGELKLKSLIREEVSQLFSESPKLLLFLILRTSSTFAQEQN